MGANGLYQPSDLDDIIAMWPKLMLALPDRSVSGGILNYFTATGGVIQSGTFRYMTSTAGIFATITANNLTATTGYFLTATAVNVYGSTLSYGTVTATNVTGTNAVFTSVTATNYIGLASAFTNLTGTNTTATNLLVTNITSTSIKTGTITATGFVDFQSTGSANAFAGNVGINARIHNLSTADSAVLYLEANGVNSSLLVGGNQDVVTGSDFSNLGVISVFDPTITGMGFGPASNQNLVTVRFVTERVGIRTVAPNYTFEVIGTGSFVDITANKLIYGSATGLNTIISSAGLSYLTATSIVTTSTVSTNITGTNLVITTVSAYGNVFVTGNTNSTGSANYLNITAGLLNITSTATFNRSIVISTGHIFSQSSGSINDANLPIQLNSRPQTVNYFAFNKGGTYGLLVGYDNGSLISSSFAAGNIRMVTNDPLVFYVQNTLEAARITSGGSLAFANAGESITIKEGTNARMGTLTLIAGTATASCTSITTNSRIFLTTQSTGGTVGFVYVDGVTAASKFGVRSSNAADTSTVAYFIVEPS